MDSIFHWIGVVGAFGFVAVCLIGFVRGLSLPPNETRVQGRGEHWTSN
ncbi:hypothetical protein [Afipia sp. GAS231]|nr:hypothetical protein [Afipia sp. GAS231]SDP42836.1 hypothetical protein SAMN05444050_6826 [Afipia sp. GAS231]